MEKRTNLIKFVWKKVKQFGYITELKNLNNMTISEAYTTIDNCNHFIANAKKFLMLRLKRIIGADKEVELKTPVSVEIPEKGFVDVCKVQYANEDCLWLYWKDPKVIPSGYNVAQSWKAERVEDNRWVEKLKEIVDQFEY